MIVETVCQTCRKPFTQDLPEGLSTAWFECCGQQWAIMSIMEPYGKAFTYGLEAVRRKRYTASCVHFATAFEVFQKRAAFLSLVLRGSPEHLAKLIIYDLSLGRSQVQNIVNILLHTQLPVPDVDARNRAVHFGKVPKPPVLIHLAESVLAACDAWIKVLRKRAGTDFDRLESAYGARTPLPQDVAQFDRSVFDLRATLALLTEDWARAKKAMYPRNS